MTRSRPSRETVGRPAPRGLEIELRRALRPMLAQVRRTLPKIKTAGAARALGVALRKAWPDERVAKIITKIGMKVEQRGSIGWSRYANAVAKIRAKRDSFARLDAPNTKAEAVAEARAWLERNGVTASPGRTLTTAIAEREQAGKGSLPPPIIVVQIGNEGLPDLIIRDGNHRIAAAYIAGDRTMPMRVIVARTLASGEDVETEIKIASVPINPPELAGRALESLNPNELARARAAPEVAASTIRRVKQAAAATRRRAPFDGQKLVNKWSKDATKLITSVRDEVAEGLRRDVLRALENGEDPADLAERWIARGVPVEFGTLEGRMKVIAQHQIATLHAQVQSERARAVGVTDFVWRTQQDDRVREEHRALEGTQHRYDDPPDEGLPGTPINCRCWAESVIDDSLLGELGLTSIIER